MKFALTFANSGKNEKISAYGKICIFGWAKHSNAADSINQKITSECKIPKF